MENEKNESRKLTPIEWNQVSMLLGYAAGAKMKNGELLEHHAKMAIDKLMVQQGGYTYYHPKEIVEAALKDENVT